MDNRYTMTGGFSTQAKRELVDKIALLSKDEHLEIFKIIKKNTSKFSENTNGIFINLSVLDDLILNDINKFLIFCYQNQQNLEHKEDIMNNEIKKIFEKQEEQEGQEENKIKIITHKIIVEHEEESEDEEEEVELDDSKGSKISLKRQRPKYSGIKARLIKNYSDGQVPHKEMSSKLERIMDSKKMDNDEDDNELENEYELIEEVEEEVEEIEDMLEQEEQQGETEVEDENDDEE